MRDALVNALMRYADDPSFVFLTGDLGFGALEPLREAMGDRFINAGVAEQNMVGVAAGLAKSGMKVAVYSIAPFLYARAFEQIRNDVCFHNLPVLLIGNGGGYGYGVMGPTHHALEDYGTLCTLPNMRAYVPAFSDDVEPVMEEWWAYPSPAYLRLGKCEKPDGMYQMQMTCAPWRGWSGDKGVMVAVGPIAGSLLGAFRSMPVSDKPVLWIVTDLPIADRMPESVRFADSITVVEEHVAQGSVGMMLAYKLGKPIQHFCAKGYPSGRYGSQAFHRKECGLDAETILKEIR